MIDLDRPEFFIQVPGGQEFGPAGPDLLRQWAREGRIPIHALIITRDGAPGVVAWQHPVIGGILAAPPTAQGPLGVPDGDATGGLIPYKNPKALLGYYTAIASLAAMLLPGAGLLVSIAAIVLGLLGLKAVRAQPRLRGEAHAQVAILLGTLTMLLNVAITIGLLAIPTILSV